MTKLGDLFKSPRSIPGAIVPSAKETHLLRLKDGRHLSSPSVRGSCAALIWEGRLPVVQDGEGSPFLFDQHDLDSYVESHKRNFPL